MSVVRRNGHWIVVLVGVVCLAFSAGVMAQKGPINTSKDEPEAVARGLSDARELSAVFRRTAKAALPAIVSIETRGKAMRVASHNMPEGDDLENSPFGELFKRDPRFKDYFHGRPQGGAPRSHGMGSGVIIDSAGIVLTNAHVVQDADSVKVKLSDGREFSASSSDIKTDTRSDVAIIRIKADGKLPSVKLGNSDATEVGEWVLAVGSPFGLDLTVTAGIISAKGRGPGIADREDFLQTDAAINPGNSGGPLLNLDGEVIGINTAISTRSGGYDGVGFAVPINMARWVAEQLIEKGSVSRAYLGVAIQPVDNELARQFKVPVGRGALVNQVMPDSPAAEGKVEPGDLILKLDGKDVQTTRGLQGIVEQLKIGGSYPLLVLRNGKEATLNIKMKEMPKNFSLHRESEPAAEEPPQAPSKSGSFDDLGVELTDLTPAVAKQLGLKASQGILVSSVVEDGPAASAGLREGMVIEKVGHRAVHSVAEFKEAVKDLSVSEGILLLVRNKSASQYIVLRQDQAEAAQK